MVLHYNFTVDDLFWIKLDRISDYYVTNLERPDLAAKTIKTIIGKVRDIESNPFAFHIYGNDETFEIRFAHYRSYNIFYVVDKKHNLVKVFDILLPHQCP